MKTGSVVDKAKPLIIRDNKICKVDFGTVQKNNKRARIAPAHLILNKMN